MMQKFAFNIGNHNDTYAPPCIMMRSPRGIVIFLVSAIFVSQISFFNSFLLHILTRRKTGASLRKHLGSVHCERVTAQHKVHRKLCYVRNNWDCFWILTFLATTEMRFQRTVMHQVNLRMLREKF